MISYLTSLKCIQEIQIRSVWNPSMQNKNFAINYSGEGKPAKDVSQKTQNLFPIVL